MIPLPVEAAHRLAAVAAEPRWLVEGLWAEEAVGIVGGEPKCCKSFLALDLAVSVASATPCLRRFPVPRPGRVLLYAAEDALHVVRRRLEGICCAAAVELKDIDIQVITAPTLRLDLESDRARLAQTVAALRPKLLVLDPFVRLHRIDENASGEVAPLLAYLRELQRRHQLAVAVVHHSKKGAARARAGQALRGSSEFHAWGDSNLYLRRHGDDLTLTVEHRAAASIAPIALQLHRSRPARQTHRPARRIRRGEDHPRPRSVRGSAPARCAPRLLPSPHRDPLHRSRSAHQTDSRREGRRRLPPRQAVASPISLSRRLYSVRETETGNGHRSA